MGFAGDKEKSGTPQMGFAGQQPAVAYRPNCAN
jgi:hypothetical protein